MKIKLQSEDAVWNLHVNFGGHATQTAIIQYEIYFDEGVQSYRYFFSAIVHIVAMYVATYY